MSNLLLEHRGERALLVQCKFLKHFKFIRFDFVYFSGEGASFTLSVVGLLVVDWVSG